METHTVSSVSGSTVYLTVPISNPADYSIGGMVKLPTSLTNPDTLNWDISSNTTAAANQLLLI
ncbi:MAG: hypothetical protein U0457_05385 [Candidatus Sericytochromatia bacterium]